MGPVGFQSWLVVVVLVRSAVQQQAPVEAYEKCALNGDPHLRGFPNGTTDGNRGDVPYPCYYEVTKTISFVADSASGTTFRVRVRASNAVTAESRFVLDSVNIHILEVQTFSGSAITLITNREDMEANLASAGDPWTTSGSLGFSHLVSWTYDNSTGTATLTVKDSSDVDKIAVDFFPRLSPPGFQHDRGLHVNVSSDALPDTSILFPATACSNIGDNTWGTATTFNNTALTVVYGLLSQGLSQNTLECQLSEDVFHNVCVGNANLKTYFEECSPFFEQHKVVRCVNKNAGVGGAAWEAFALCLKNKCNPGIMTPDELNTYNTVLNYDCTSTP